MSEFVLIFFNSFEGVDIDFHSVARGLNMRKNKTLPDNPKNCKDIQNAFGKEDIMSTIGSSIQDENIPFYDGSYECEDFGYCIFSSKGIIGLIDTHIEQTDREFLLDATFKICPFGNFYQLLIIYIKYQQKVCLLKLNRF